MEIVDKWDFLLSYAEWRAFIYTATLYLQNFNASYSPFLLSFYMKDKSWDAEEVVALKMPYTIGGYVTTSLT